MRCVGRFSPSNYEVEHISGRNMGLVGSLLSPAAVDAPIVSEIDNDFVLAQIDSMNMLLLPSVFSNTGVK